MMMRADTALVVASNRLPVVAVQRADGRCTLAPGSGGLVTALLPVLRNRGGTWVGWPGRCDDHAALAAELAAAGEKAGYRLEPVILSGEEEQKFYQGFSNEIIWPLFHDLQSHCNFDPAYWAIYQQVNRRYADVLARHGRDGDFVWVHDYHLTGVATELRRLGKSAQLAFFLHIPFPPLDIFLKLPWRFQLLRGLLDYGLIGFQTPRDLRNFLGCIRHLMPEVRVHGSRRQVGRLQVEGREVRAGSFPISIDFNTFVKRAAAPEILAKVTELKALLPNRQLILGIDRLDYTKGIPHRLRAFRLALTRYPELHEHVTLIQVVVPSREDIPRYHELKSEIEQLVGQVNGQFTHPGGWVPIHYVFRSLTRTELLAYYRAAQIAFITPLKDGMNLVAKEYCACSIEEDSVLILSEFAGAATELQHGALLVNPYDIESMADAIHRAVNMPDDDRRARMRRLRREIRDHDIFWWVDSFLRAAIAKDLSDFPRPPDYVPQSEFGDLSV
jgi:trehalose 6-phosphate synthase